MDDFVVDDEEVEYSDDSEAESLEDFIEGICGVCVRSVVGLLWWNLLLLHVNIFL